MSPAVLGSPPAFPEGLPFARPMTPPLSRVTELLEPSYDAGVLTNGPLTRRLEEELGARLGVRHAIAVANCTSGLLLALQASDPKGTVAVPSFTFSATVHAVAWNGRTPVFVECDRDTWQVDVADLEHRLDAVDAGGILVTHVFGAPCAAGAVTELGRRRGVPVVFDAAHALGAVHDGHPVGGFGDAEVFSLSPTKLLVAGEGGIVSTNDDDLARTVRLGRDYGNPGDYDSVFPGLNARLSELHAALAIASLELLDVHLARRRALADRYHAGLASVPGITSQHVPAGDTSVHKDLTVLVDETAFGLDRDRLAACLRAEGIDTRPYFSPPVHRHHAYAEVEGGELPTTDWVAARVVSLPLFGDLDLSAVDRVVEAIAGIHAHAAEIAARP